MRILITGAGGPAVFSAYSATKLLRPSPIGSNDEPSGVALDACRTSRLISSMDPPSPLFQ
jgi:hypothetical protein